MAKFKNSDQLIVCKSINEHLDASDYIGKNVIVEECVNDKTIFPCVFYKCWLEDRQVLIAEENLGEYDIIYDYTEETLEQLEEERWKHSQETFVKATAYSSFLKLKEEIEELDIDLKKFEKQPHSRDIRKALIEEYVDCAMCLFDSFKRKGITFEEFKYSFKQKLIKNKNRRWELGSDKNYRHI